MTSPDHDRLVATETRLAALEARIAELERAAARQMPWEWPSSPAPVWPSVEDARCGVCGGRYADMTHYVCSHPQCPNMVTCFAGTPPGAEAIGQTPAHLVGTTTAGRDPALGEAGYNIPINP